MTLLNPANTVYGKPLASTQDQSTQKFAAKH